MLAIRLAVAKIHLLNEVEEILVCDAEPRPYKVPHRCARQSEAAYALLEFLNGDSRPPCISPSLRHILCDMPDLAMKDEVDELVFHVSLAA